VAEDLCSYSIRKQAAVSAPLELGDAGSRFLLFYLHLRILCGGK